MLSLVKQTNSQEVRLTLLEQQIDDINRDYKEISSTVEANKLTLAKAGVLAMLAALVIPVMLELGTELILDNGPGVVEQRR